MGQSFGGNASERLRPNSWPLAEGKEPSWLLGSGGSHESALSWIPRGESCLDPPRYILRSTAKPELHLTAIRLCDFLYWQTVCQQLLLAEQPRCAYKEFHTQPHAHCHFARLHPGPGVQLQTEQSLVGSEGKEACPPGA